MPFSFKPLWKLLIDKNMTKEELRIALKLSPSTIARMGKGEYISLKIIDKICQHLNCKIQEVIEHIPSKESAKKS